MTSKITDAIHQLKKSIISLVEASTGVRDTIVEKEEQIEKMRMQYIQTHTKAFAGNWDLNLHNDTDYILKGWRYTDDYWESIGNKQGDALSIALGIPSDEDELTTIEIPYGDAEPTAYARPHIMLSFRGGDIELVLYKFAREEMFGFLKEKNITVEIPAVDNQIIFYQEHMEYLQEFKQAVVNDSSCISEQQAPEMFVDCVASDTTALEILMHTPTRDDTKPIEEDGIQFNAEEVSVLHKRIGVNCEYLTNLMASFKAIKKNGDIDTIYHGMENLQREIDGIAAMVGDLDTKNEPVDIGMAGCAYWNILEAARYHLAGTLDYVNEQHTLPLFGEVHYRLTKLTEMLKNCTKEFEDTWM